MTALEPSVLYRMSVESLRQMKSQSPDLAAAFREFMCRMLAERLVNTNKLLEQVLD